MCAYAFLCFILFLFSQLYDQFHGWIHIKWLFQVVRISAVLNSKNGSRTYSVITHCCDAKVRARSSWFARIFDLPHYLISLLKLCRLPNTGFRMYLMCTEKKTHQMQKYNFKFIVDCFATYNNVQCIFISNRVGPFERLNNIVNDGLNSLTNNLIAKSKPIWFLDYARNSATYAKCRSELNFEHIEMLHARLAGWLANKNIA